MFASFKEIGVVVLKKKIFQGFYIIWAWQPSWSRDLNQIYKLSSPLSLCLETAYENSIETGPVVSEEKSSENVDDGQTMDGRWKMETTIL